MGDLSSFYLIYEERKRAKFDEMGGISVDTTTTNRLIHGYSLIKCSHALFIIICVRGGLCLLKLSIKKDEKLIGIFDPSKRLQKFQTFFSIVFASNLSTASLTC